MFVHDEVKRLLLSPWLTEKIHFCFYFCFIANPIFIHFHLNKTMQLELIISLMSDMV